MPEVFKELCSNKNQKINLCLSIYPKAFHVRLTYQFSLVCSCYVSKVENQMNKEAIS